MIVLLDQDGPLANFEKGFLQKWKKKYPDELYIPLDERETFYVRDQYPDRLREQVESIYHAPGFYRDLPPTEGAKEAVGQMLDMGIDVRICTSPLSRYENCVLEKYEWIDQHFGRKFTKKMCVVKDKTLVRGDVLIDDRPEVNGVVNPEWRHIVFDAPSNNHLDKRKFNWSDNWEQITSL